MIKFITGLMGSGKTEKAIKVNQIKKVIKDYLQIIDQEFIFMVASGCCDIGEAHVVISSRNGDEIISHTTSLDNRRKWTQKIIKNPQINFIFIIDEAQFLSEEDMNWIWSLDLHPNTEVYLFGLMTDFRGDLFPIIPTILRYSESIEYLPKVCDVCGEKLAFTNIRYDLDDTVTNDGDVTFFDKDFYKTVCKKCYARLWEEKYEAGNQGETAEFERPDS